MCIILPIRYQCGNTFYAYHRSGASRQRQGKIAHAAEQIQYPIIGLNTEPFKGLGHHLLIYVVIYLNKVTRTEV
ncbi:hypothetical protein D3C71_1527220 [compost metagenome]